MTAVVCAPLGVERAALRRSGSPLRVVRTGMGRLRPAAVAALGAADALLVAGVAGGLTPQVRPGDLVVATEVRGRDATLPCPSGPPLAAALRLLGLPVHAGPVHTSDRVAFGASRRMLAATGALAVDMESAELAVLAAGRPFAVVRAVVDAPGYPLWHPGTVPRGLAALRALRRSVPALAAWCAAAGTRTPESIRPEEVS